MIYFYVVPMLMWWVLITLSIYSPKVSEYTQISDTADAAIAFVFSLIPLANIAVAVFVLIDSKVRFHK